MHIEEELIFFDLETAGLEPEQHPIIQIAAIAVDSSLCELETFELKIRFDEANANPQSLSVNRYSKQVWQSEAVEAAIAAQRFSAFLRRHATVDMVSKTGKPYQVAQLVAHNGERFDGPFLHAWYRKLSLFCPARYMVLCTKQRALWLFDEDKSLTPPTDFKLQTLCQYFHIRLSSDDAHDAFNDVRATAELYRACHRHFTSTQQTSV
jgi:DNA polymerase III epsilon subunit-like protein